MPILLTLFILAGALYGASFGFVCLSRSNAVFASWARKSAWLGFAAHTLMMGFYIYYSSRAPFYNSYFLLESLAWAFVLSQMMGVVIFKTRAILFFSMPAAAILVLLPFGCPLFLQNFLVELDKSVKFASIHALLALFSYATTALAAVVGALYLWQKRSLLEKSSTPIFDDIPSLRRLFSIERTALAIAAALMLCAIIFGGISAVRVSLTPLMVLKFSLGSFVFAMQIFLCALAWTRKVPESKVCAGAIILAVVSFLLLIPMELRNFF